MKHKEVRKLRMRNKEKHRDRFLCDMPFTTTSGRQCRCEFMDFAKLAYRFDPDAKRMSQNGRSAHTHISLTWNEKEGGKQSTITTGIVA